MRSKSDASVEGEDNTMTAQKLAVREKTEGDGDNYARLVTDLIQLYLNRR